MIPAIAKINIRDVNIPNVIGIANVVNNAITETPATPRTIEFINPSNPKYHVNVNIINKIIVAKIKKMIRMSTTSFAGLVHEEDKISKLYPCVEKLILAAS
jgi:hypothetical protein